MEEVWKDVVGYEGLYEVSNLGRVRSLDRYVAHYNAGTALRKGRMLKPAFDGHYLSIGLSKGNKVKCSIPFLTQSVPSGIAKGAPQPAASPSSGVTVSGTRARPTQRRTLASVVGLCLTSFAA